MQTQAWQCQDVRLGLWAERTDNIAQKFRMPLFFFNFLDGAREDYPVRRDSLKISGGGGNPPSQQRQKQLSAPTLGQEAKGHKRSEDKL